jgi:uncharacterized protein (TIGR00255 family)
MTGYGKGTAPVGGGELTVEVRTVNHRFIDFSIRLPRSMSGYEIEIEKAVRRKISRGHVYVTVTFGRGIESNSVTLNRKLLKKTWKEISGFARKEGIPGEIDIGTLLALPDMFRPEIENIPRTRLKDAVRRAVTQAVDRCVKMRQGEGKTLLADIRKRLKMVERVAGKIEKMVPRALEDSLGRSRERIERLIDQRQLDDDRWAIEAAVIAEKTDFSEELVRLKSHIKQFSSMIAGGGEVSKKLTFLLQEIHREVTTMSNKTLDSQIITLCVSLKEQVEKIREQVQNLE